ncbi:GL17842 [Drosophila persimilis]|uniref:GL17842 n=1 Tax=Drosophila persimilis TaxID=7234 RepID=B4H272_DROPE|nr:GL17842 [Drosophila persimilis]
MSSVISLKHSTVRHSKTALALTPAFVALMGCVWAKPGIGLLCAFGGCCLQPGISRQLCDSLCRLSLCGIVRCGITAAHSAAPILLRK